MRINIVKERDGSYVVRYGARGEKRFRYMTAADGSVARYMSRQQARHAAVEAWGITK